MGIRATIEGGFRHGYVKLADRSATTRRQVLLDVFRGEDTGTKMYCYGQFQMFDELKVPTYIDRKNSVRVLVHRRDGFEMPESPQDRRPIK